MGTVVSLAQHRAASAPPVTWSQITANSDEFCSWCLMLIEQLDFVRSGHTIDVPKQYPIASIRRAQAALKERGYPTDFSEGGEHGFGVLTFQ